MSATFHSPPMEVGQGAARVFAPALPEGQAAPRPQGDVTFTPGVPPATVVLDAGVRIFRSSADGARANPAAAPVLPPTAATAHPVDQRLAYFRQRLTLLKG